MKYDPIIIKRNREYIEFYFDRYGREDWFYEFDVKNEKEINEWDEHLKGKLWYTPHIREQVLKIAKEIINERTTNN